MPAHPHGAVARQTMVSVRLSFEELAELDGKRGTETRSDFLRSLVHRIPPRKDA